MQLAVVVPVYKDGLTEIEAVSWRHLQAYLSDFELRLATPSTLALPRHDLRRVNFAAQHFSSVASYSRLLLSPEFYTAFQDVEFILIYQLDSLVFSNQLLAWSQRGFDYIGAPLFKNKDGRQKGLSRVGNGGFSLRSIPAALRVLTSNSRPNLRALWSDMMPDVPKTRIRKRLQVLRAARRGVRWYTGHYTLNEDLFWSDRARLFDPSFKIAPVEVGLRFAFDSHPRYCFEQNGNKIPFGAHAWAKWDRSFWEPHLLSWM